MEVSEVVYGIGAPFDRDRAGTTGRNPKPWPRHQRAAGDRLAAEEIQGLVFAHTRGYVPGVFLLLTTLGIQRRASPAAAVRL